MSTAASKARRSPNETPAVQTLGQLRETGYRYRPVKQELRENLIDRLRNQGGLRDLFPGVRGYEDTVLPQIVHALFARHDMLLLGLRGQAKTRMIRQLPKLLDPWCPVIDGCDMPDDPMHPMTGKGQRLVEEHGNNTPIRWLSPAERFHEKLATPDVTIADLIGEIDIVKHAEGRYLSDEETMHLGLIPRTNRGIFAVNELPDLAPRIQVGLFNVLEERDIQVRGYPIRLPLDLTLVFSANPEDYTNRGRIVTPLKDRIGSVIRTHYPRSVHESVKITGENAWISRNGAPDSDGDPSELNTPKVEVPAYLRTVIETMVAQARESSHINQASGVSVRCSIACLETLVSSAERRGLITGETPVLPRVCDLGHMLAATRGKIELLMAEDGQETEDRLVESLLGEAVKSVFDDVAVIDDYEHIADAFTSGLKLTLGDDTSGAEAVASMEHVDGLLHAAKQLAPLIELDPDHPDLGTQYLASAGEFVLEALYVHKRLSKQSTAAGGRYSR
ncbi:MAG: magnesium chelatase [Planctomycetota bacterium]